MASVALIKNHHDLFIAHILNMSVVIVFCDCAIQLLNCGDYDFCIAVETADKLLGIVRAINGSRFKGFIFSLCLSVEVVTVNDKKHLVYFIDLRNELCRLNDVKVFPAPVVCQIYPLSLLLTTRSRISSTA